MAPLSFTLEGHNDAPNALGRPHAPAIALRNAGRWCAMRPTVQRLVVILAVGVIGAPPQAGAKDGGGVPQVGILTNGSEAALRTRVEAFRQGLRDLGYIEGQTIALDYRYADAKSERLSALAGELVRLNVAVIVAHGTPASLAAKQATSAIPIVMFEVGDPVAAQLVSNIGRPGGNVTGLAQVGVELYGKQLEILKEVIPKLSGVAMLWNPANPAQERVLKATQAAAKRLSITVQPLGVRDPGELEKAIVSAARNQAGAVLVSRDLLFAGLLGQVVELSGRHGLPVIGGHRAVAEAGGLMAYGPDTAGMARRATVYVDRILKGASAGDLPVEQPTNFDLIINAKAAKALGLTIPHSVMLRANAIIP